MRYLPPSGFAHTGQTLAAWNSALKNLVNGDAMTSSEEPLATRETTVDSPPFTSGHGSRPLNAPFPWKPTVIGLVISLIPFVFYRLLQRPRQ
jgi:hypothetical protein